VSTQENEHRFIEDKAWRDFAKSFAEKWRTALRAHEQTRAEKKTDDADR
jgi:hypothetical protein